MCSQDGPALGLLCRRGPLKIAPLLCLIQCSSSVQTDRSFVSYLQLFSRHRCDARSLVAVVGLLLAKVVIAGCYVL